VSESVEGLPQESTEIQAAFKRVILGLADTKRILGIRYSDWLLGAPSIEAGIAASSMAQDEWGHARLLYASLKAFGDDPTALEHGREPEDYLSWESLDAPLEDWAQLTAAMVIVDGALSLGLESLLEGGYAPLTGRVEKMLGEEEFHASLGQAWFRRLSSGEGEGRERLQSSAEAMLLPTTLSLAPGDDTHAWLADRGLVLPSGTIRHRLAQRLDPLLKPLGLSVPVDASIPSAWDLGRRRGPGAPAAEAVERARGDRNRALFVE
jgi:ring-1,2-phenylacetyl-CoA epoxidase subunit PaaC